MTAITERGAVLAVLEEQAAEQFMELSGRLQASLGRAPLVSEITECCAISYGHGCGILSVFSPSLKQLNEMNALATKTAQKTASSVASNDCVGRA